MAASRAASMIVLEYTASTDSHYLM